MDRLRTMSQASSHKVKLESVPPSPEPILRDTAFTPTADQVCTLDCLFFLSIGMSENF